MTTFLDTNVLVGLTKPSDSHHAWATKKLIECKANGPALVADLVYCEFSITLPDVAAVDAVIAGLALERFATSDAALFRAGKAYQQYRANGGPRTSVLPDFLIGAVAEQAGAPLLTANPKDFLGYFPNVQLISP
jgi:predicted nucleic acid-binding protein